MRESGLSNGGFFLRGYANAAQVNFGTQLTLSFSNAFYPGIKEIGIKIEKPFCYDASNLSLDAICNTIQQNMEDCIATETVEVIAPSKDEKVLIFLI